MPLNSCQENIPLSITHLALIPSPSDRRKIKPHANIDSKGGEQMSAFMRFTVSSFHILSEFVAPLRLTYALHASSTSVTTQACFTDWKQK